LVIEDESDVLDLLTAQLGFLGCRVSGAQTGCAGVALAVADPPDVVVVDMMLPDIDGREVMRRLRAHDVTARCPIVLCSVLDLDDLTDLDVDAVLPKPFGKADVARMVRQFTTAE
jgi:CheY-like chemotaxis protein